MIHLRPMLPLFWEGSNICVFKRATVFGVGHRLSKHKMTKNARILGVHDLFANPWLHLCQCPHSPASLKSSRCDTSWQSAELWNLLSPDCQPLLFQSRDPSYDWLFGHVCPEHPGKDWRRKFCCLPTRKRPGVRPRTRWSDCILTFILAIECNMKFVAEELPTFSIKTFNVKNLLNSSDMTLWPLKNSSVAHWLRNSDFNHQLT